MTHTRNAFKSQPSRFAHRASDKKIERRFLSVFDCPRPAACKNRRLTAVAAGSQVKNPPVQDEKTKGGLITNCRTNIKRGGWRKNPDAGFVRCGPERTD